MGDRPLARKGEALGQEKGRVWNSRGRVGATEGRGLARAQAEVRRLGAWGGGLPGAEEQIQGG